MDTGYTRGDRSQLRAFTLIELLVVISIIAVLAGMLLPAVGLVRDAARTSVCAGNLRQMQIANAVYKNEHGTWVPGFGYDGTNATDLWITNTAFIDYLSDGKVTDGDSAKLQRGLFCPVSRPDFAWGALRLSYGNNFGQVEWPFAVGPHIFKGNAPIVSFVDGLDNWVSTNTGYNELNNAYWVAGTPLPEGFYSLNTAAFRHRAKANAVFYDGHVQSMAFAELNTWRLWNVP